MNYSSKIRPEEIDEYIDQWHDEYTGGDTLEEFLGMTAQQYNDWVDNPNSINSLFNCERQRDVIVSKKLIKIPKEILQ